MSKKQRTLIRSTNWIGDAVMSLPALRELRRLYPEDELVILAKDWVADVFEEQGIADEILRFDSRQRSLRQVGRLKGFDRAVLLQNAFEAALLARLARIPERYGYAVQHRGFLLTHSGKPRIKDLGRHQVYYYLDLLFQTGLSSINYLETPDLVPDIRLSPTKAGLRETARLLEQNSAPPKRYRIGLNPGAYFGPAKRWMTDRYAALADRLIQELDAEVLIFGSAGELKIAEEIKGFMQETPRILTGKTTLPGLIGLISECNLFITNDSGPMHRAAALSTPMIAIFGSTDEIATGPFSDRAQVIHKHVECSPCLRRTCPIDLRCFTRISVEEVFAAARSTLEEVS
ncbi:MAG: lipopolysaccharide heptosyltransferase II [Acidobacteriota bacterium]|nr:MAG: lipopolysaccharide heptosyltransferase II [Acidobacteriota bacterium]